MAVQAGPSCARLSASTCILSVNDLKKARAKVSQLAQARGAWFFPTMGGGLAIRVVVGPGFLFSFFVFLGEVLQYPGAVR